MIQKSFCKAKAKLYAWGDTNLVSERHGHPTICVTQHCDGQDELYEYGDNPSETSGKVTREEG